MPSKLRPAVRIPFPAPWRAALLARLAAAVIALAVVLGQAGALLAEDRHSAAVAFRQAGWTAAELAAAGQQARRCTLAQRHQRAMIAGTSSSRQPQDDRNHGDDCRG